MNEQPYINGVPVHITIHLDDAQKPTKLHATVDGIMTDTVYMQTDWKAFADDKTFRQAQQDVVQEAVDWMEDNKD